MTELLARALGDELRRERKRRGWTRQDLHARLARDLAVPTLATYELGTRPLSVERLVELGDALEVSVLDVLARALGRVGKVERVNRLEIDLHAIVRDRTPGLVPLRRWARVRLRDAIPHEPAVLRLDLPALTLLAEICGVDAGELIGTLVRLARKPHDACDGQRMTTTTESSSASYE